MRKAGPRSWILEAMGYLQGEMYFRLGAAFALSGAVMVGAQAPAVPDLILHNARVYTVDARNSGAEAVAIAGDLILQVGSDAAVLGLKRSLTRVVDLRGATVVPGLHDAHAHVVGL